MPPEVKVNPVPTRFICNNRIKDHLEVGSHRGRPGSPLVFSLSLSLCNFKYQISKDKYTSGRRRSYIKTYLMPADAEQSN